MISLRPTTLLSVLVILAGHASAFTSGDRRSLALPSLSARRSSDTDDSLADHIILSARRSSDDTDSLTDLSLIHI